MKKKDPFWIEKATAKHKGSFKAAAKRAGKSTSAYAKSVLKKGSGASAKMKKKASLAKTLSKIRPPR